MTGSKYRSRAAGQRLPEDNSRLKALRMQRQNLSVESRRGSLSRIFIEVRAPKPTLLTFVSGDEYLSLQGAREAFREALKAYEALGGKDNLELVEDDSKHWMTPKIRTAIYGFFMKHFNLKGSPGRRTR